MPVQIPNQWSPRPHQHPLVHAFINDLVNRGVAVWHRRAGKDSTSLNLTCVKAHQRVGTYWHMLPTQKQARKVVWDAIDRQGRRVIDQVFPKEIRAATHNTDMKIELRCGSIWQCVGSDAYDSLVGTNPVGIVFSEYSVADPAAWAYLRPILAENGGWALFIYTPRGRNHGSDLYEVAAQRDNWFCEMLTVNDTRNHDGTPLISGQAIQDERDDGMSDEMIEQEFYCSFDAGIVGSFFSKEMREVRESGRILEIPHDPHLPVHTFWDLGLDDATAIWYMQSKAGGFKDHIDYDIFEGMSLEEIIRIVLKKPYVYRSHYGPHDLRLREYSTGITREQFAADLGLPFEVAERLPIADTISMARVLLRQCRFDAVNCALGLDALMNYKRRWDEKNRVFMEKPLHDWSSHGADAFRVEATVYKDDPFIDGDFAGQSTHDSASIGAELRRRHPVRRGVRGIMSDSKSTFRPDLW